MENIIEQPAYSIEMDYWDERIQVLNHCDSFAILDQRGDVSPLGKELQGLYFCDTRYISLLELRLNNYRCTLLSSSIKEENEILSTDLTNPEMTLENDTLVPAESIHIKRSQFVKENFFHEEIAVTNFNDDTLSLALTLRFYGDFRDIFEVRGQKRGVRGTVLPVHFPDNRTVTLSYVGLDNVTRKAEISFQIPFIKDPESEKITFPIRLLHREAVKLEYSITFWRGEDQFPKGKSYLEAWEDLAPDIRKTRGYFPIIETSNQQFSHWINRSQTDLVSLIADTLYGKYPYAGVPWYNTAFGRDALLTAFETLWMAPDLSKDVLLFLAAYQSDTINESTDAEPGKILHEMRSGEMAALNEVPFRQYYGTIDATPLFVLLAGAYYDRTADIDMIRKIWPNIKKAIRWINEYGDIDGDGFVEYVHKAANGLTNQGWKDSFDSISYQNGQLCEPPIALCEVQAYTYAAKMHAARLAILLEEEQLAAQLEIEARNLKTKFNETFWDEQLNCYVIALDGGKQPCRIISSNAGHVLFTGIADQDKAGKLVETLMGPDMFNGWGIRTLSSREARYNPMSYHNGSVWPHDVALIAAGMSAYGFREQVLKLVAGLFDASLFIHLQRLPELFCGFNRRKGEGPTSYPVACSPQAWSVGSVFLLLKALLQIRITPERREVQFVKPILPDYLQRIHIKKLRIGNVVTEIDIAKAGNCDDGVSITWKNQPEGWKLVIIQ